MKNFIKNLQINKTKKTLLLVLLFISFWSIAFATSGTIWNLFNLYTGSENGVTVTNEYRLIWTNIRDDTITSYEIQDWTIQSSDLAAWVWWKWLSTLSDIYYSAWNVGIWTNTPRSKLDVVWGDLKIDWATLKWTESALIYNSNTWATQIVLRDVNDNTSGRLYWDWWYFWLLDSIWNWGILIAQGLYTSFSINNDEKMRIQSNGNVGIWTIAPTSKLEVNWIIKTSSGWIQFPDDTIQTTAAVGWALSCQVCSKVYRKAWPCPSVTTNLSWFTSYEVCSNWNSYSNPWVIGDSSGDCIMESVKLVCEQALPPTFISVWDTTLTSAWSSANNQVKLPLESTWTYNFNIDWWDGTSDIITSWDQAEVTHTYASTWIYTIKIDWEIKGWRFGYSWDRLKLSEIQDWWTLNVWNNNWYFSWAENFNFTWTGNLDLTWTTNMDNMFSYAYSFNWDISNWDISNVTSMWRMFYYANSFNQPLNSWDVSSVTNMSYMLSNLPSFNQPLNSWDVSSVTNMTAMFSQSPSFNQPLNSWDVSSVTNMVYMFWRASSFNWDISNWDVSNVTHMTSMLEWTTLFNQNISGWNVSNVLYMPSMFVWANSFNQDLSSWNTSGVISCTSVTSATPSWVLPKPSFPSCTP